MITAYILLRIKPGKDRNVLNTVTKLPPIKTVETLYGEFDMLLKAEVPTLEELDSFIFETIRTINGVDVSTTLITMRFSGEQNVEK